MESPHIKRLEQGRPLHYPADSAACRLAQEKESAKLNILQKLYDKGGWQAVPFPESSRLLPGPGRSSGPIKWTTLGILKK